MATDIDRRQFISVLASATAAWPFTARAQQSAMPVVGFLSSRSPDESANSISAFRKGLQEKGFVEGQNVQIVFRWAEGAYAKLPELATDLVNRHVTVLAAISPQAVRAAKAATTTIPIVFQSGVDPVLSGLVGSINKPGGNLTGFYRVASELVPKSLELLRDVLPAATAVAVLENPASLAFDTQSKDAQAATQSLGLRLHMEHASTEHGIDTAFASLAQTKVDALVIGNDSFFISRSEQLAALAVRYSVPAIVTFREFSKAGGLLSYDASLADQYRQVGVYVGRILKGEKPADLPVQQATKYDFVINLKTAKTLGITIPSGVLARADEVIE